MTDDIKLSVMHRRRHAADFNQGSVTFVEVPDVN